ncbi:MAG: non-canonical purine NTP diphosphatase [Prolixibacteraceae bacterium]|nr:non-canonical purine NTP diphosphatase [Prolixibacteraceae bacterium]
MRLVFATNNKHKLKELQSLLGGRFELLSLEDAGCNEELAEDQDTLEGNARQKALYVYENYHYPCFADDTGLEIDSLNGAPGVYSARYAGEEKDSEANMNKVLEQLDKINNRTARFRTVIALIIDGREEYFEGVAEGEIIREKRGTNGFGYDPVFMPAGYDQTFAEMDLSVKNSISHRGMAVRKLVQYLKTL